MRHADLQKSLTQCCCGQKVGCSGVHAQWKNEEKQGGGRGRGGVVGGTSIVLQWGGGRGCEKQGMNGV